MFRVLATIKNFAVNVVFPIRSIFPIYVSQIIDRVLTLTSSEIKIEKRYENNNNKKQTKASIETI